MHPVWHALLLVRTTATFWDQEADGGSGIHCYTTTVRLYSNAATFFQQHSNVYIYLSYYESPFITFTPSGLYGHSKTVFAPMASRLIRSPWAQGRTGTNSAEGIRAPTTCAPAVQPHVVLRQRASASQGAWPNTHCLGSYIVLRERGPGAGRIYGDGG